MSVSGGNAMFIQRLQAIIDDVLQCLEPLERARLRPAVGATTRGDTAYTP
jgi:hypothetical protein